MLQYGWTLKTVSEQSHIKTKTAGPLYQQVQHLSIQATED